MPPDVWELVKADMEGRRVKGFAEYGVAVAAGNDLRRLLYWLRHRYDELLDDAVYTRATIETVMNLIRQETPDAP